MSDTVTTVISQTQFINIAAYKFTCLDQLPQRRAELLALCRSLGLKGTILLSSEGINLFLAGSRESIDTLLQHLRAQGEFSDLDVKESVSDHQPFSRMLVRLKKEIISMGVPEVRPQVKTSPKLSPSELKEWLDHGKDVVLLDVRNDYEFAIGTFENSVPLPIDHFRHFPTAVAELEEALKEKPIVMFCTGGIRCEKAGPLMEAQGFKEIYQLDGGILKYFEECGGAHYRGDCFVFDKRVALDPQLKETGLAQCYNCQAILSPEDQQSELYEPPRTCHLCHPHAWPMEQRLQRRALRLRELTTPLPGNQPYLNARPMSVTARFDQQPLIDFLTSLHAELDRDYWLKSCADGRVVYRQRPLQPDQCVRAGWQLHHLVPDTVEPPVSNEVEFLYEDRNLIVVNKSAPLPMHPCGRFNKNTLQNFLRLCYPRETIRILHRLDAETTGVLVLGRDRLTAARLQQQFASGNVVKTYLTRVLGHPANDQFECRANISPKASGPGGIRLVVDQAETGSHTKSKRAWTKFEILRRDSDNTTLLKCTPITGRTNQIRLHLAHLGLPIIGDLGYADPRFLNLDSRVEFSALVALVTENNVAGNGIPANCSPTIHHSKVLNLHAYELELEYPPKNRVSFKAAPPAWAGIDDLELTAVTLPN
jgi:RluA family pseudouridine synthase